MNAIQDVDGSIIKVIYDRLRIFVDISGIPNGALF